VSYRASIACNRVAPVLGRRLPKTYHILPGTPSWAYALALAAILMPTPGRAEPPSALTMHTWLAFEAPEPLRSPNAAPPRDGWTLAELEQMALAQNPTLAKARAQVQAAQGHCLQAGLYPNPVAGYSEEEVGDEGTAGKQGGFVAQEFVTGGKLRLDQAVASREVQRRRQLWASQQFRVLTDVRVRFYDVLVAQRRLEITRRLVDIAQQSIETTESLLQAQEVSRVDLLQARVEADSAEAMQIGAEHQLQAAWRRLVAVVGLPQLPRKPLAGEADALPPAWTWEEALRRVMAQSPELSAAAAEVAKARCQLQRERVEWIPNIDLRAAVHHDNASGDDVAAVEVGIPLPLFDRNQGNITAACAELIAAQRDLERVRLELRSRLAETFERYATARQQVELYQRGILPNARQSLELVAGGYRQGEFGYLALLTAQRTFFQASLTHLVALKALRASQSEIDGLLLHGSLGPGE